MTSVPRLKNNILITEFDNSPTEQKKYGCRFLIQLEHNNFVVSKAIKELIETLLLRPKSEEQLSELYYLNGKVKYEPKELLAIVSKHIPSALIVGNNTPEQKNPFIFSKTFLDAEQIKNICSKLTWLFNPKVMLCLFVLFLAVHTLSISQILDSAGAGWDNINLPLFLFLMLLSFLWHEIGHASACTAYKCKHGGIGCGIYFMFPVFYAEVSAAWQLTKNQRAVVDIGGIYFQSLLLVIIDIYAIAYDSALAFKLSWAITFTMLYTLNPFFKFDGYWLLSDLSGVVNLHAKMRSTLQQLFSPLVKFKKPVLPPKHERSLLLAYSILSLMFMAYFFNFLLAEINRLIKVTPQGIELWSNEFLGFSLENHLLFEQIVSLTVLFVWPLLISIFITFYIIKIVQIFSPDNTKQIQGKNNQKELEHVK